MYLSEQQQDSLIEVLNIATARTAAALSELTDQRVILNVPKVDVLLIDGLTEMLSIFVQDEIVTIHQIFNGPVSGDALLLLDQTAALTLIRLMTDEVMHSTRLTTSAREVLTEIGNILLNACMGVFGDLLQVRVTFAVPRLHVDELGELLSSLTVGQDEIQYALVVHTTFRLRDNSVNGYLVIILGVASLDHLLQSLKQLG